LEHFLEALEFLNKALGTFTGFLKDLGIDLSEGLIAVESLAEIVNTKVVLNDRLVLDHESPTSVGIKEMMTEELGTIFYRRGIVLDELNLLQEAIASFTAVT
jgi:hypothetical protein